MKNKIKWILILYFIIFFNHVVYITLLGYSDSNGNPLIILVGTIFLLVFLTGAYSSFRIKEKSDFTKASLMLPLFISFVCLFYGWDLASSVFGSGCMFTDCDIYPVIVLGSVVSIIILYFYVKII